MTIEEFFKEVYPLLLSGVIDKADKVLSTGEKVTAYRVVDIIRIDIKLKR